MLLIVHWCFSEEGKWFIIYLRAEYFHYPHIVIRKNHTNPNNYNGNKKTINQLTLSSSSGVLGFVHQLDVAPIPDNIIDRVPSRLRKK